MGGALGGAFGGGANAVAGQLLRQAAARGASTAARAAINVGVNLAGDLAAEAASQGFAAVAFGEKFPNWTGFVTAGVMSGVSTVRGGAAGPDFSPTGAGRAASSAAPTPRAAPTSTTAPTPRTASTAGARARGAVIDGLAGVGAASVVEAGNALAGGEFDATRFASSVASGAAGSRTAARGRQGPRPTPTPTSPRTRLGRAAARVGAARDSAFARIGEFENAVVGRARQAIGRPAPGDPPASSPRPPGEDADTPSTAQRNTEATSEGPVHRTEREQTSAAQHTAKGPDANADLHRPARDVSDADLADTTTHQMRIGDEMHSTSIRRRGDEVAAEVCSPACPLIRSRYAELEAHPQATPEVQAELQRLRCLTPTRSPKAARSQRRFGQWRPSIRSLGTRSVPRVERLEHSMTPIRPKP
ncbi:MAG: hypothetical protein AAFN74_27690, partial [Myxococcota bacterium]